MSALSTHAYVCDPRPDYPLLITAKRYWIPALSSNHPDALTLVLAHGTGYHKEQWEPTIEHIYEHLAAGKTGVRIRDVWSIDCPNHGEAAVLNEQTLKWGYHICLFGLSRRAQGDIADSIVQSTGRSTPVPYTSSSPAWAKA